jgi:hypothetical protein
MYAENEWVSGQVHSSRQMRRARPRGTTLRAAIEPLEVRVLLAGASISGTIFEDQSGDGLGAGDTVVGGRMVQLFRDNGDGVLNTGDALAGTTTSRADGSYSFQLLTAGRYFVRQALPANWIQTAPEATEHEDVIVTPDQTAAIPKEKNDTLATAIATGLSSATPGTYVARGEIGDNNFQSLDVDLYKVQLNAGDELHADIDAQAFGSSFDSLMRIFDASGRPLAGDDDEVNGGFDSHLEFVAPSTGTYYVGISVGVNGFYNPLVEGSGGIAVFPIGEYTIQLDAGPRQSEPLKVTLTNGAQRTGVDFAASRTGRITGQMFTDINGNGRHDSTEPGINGEPIVNSYGGTFFGFDTTHSIDLDRNGIIDPVTESGWYSIDTLPAGTHFVRTQYSFSGLQNPAIQQVSPAVDFSAQPFVGQVTSGPNSDPTPALEPDLTVDLANGLADWFQTGNTLFFAQATPNIGLGPMDLWGGADLGNGTQIVNQRIYLDSSLTTYIERDAGTFTFHPEHGHIHFEDYTTFSIRQSLPDSDGDGLPDVGAVVAGGQKTSFCLVDVAPYDLSLPNAAPEASGFGCETAQRISVGWQDIYDNLTVGQQIDVTGLAPGQYWLEANVDPDNHLLESNEFNNIGRVLISIGLGAGRDAPVGAHGVVLSSGQVAAARDFAIFRRISISGQVFNDQNNNARQDNKEHGQNGFVVFLDINGDGVLNNPEGDGLATALAKEPWTITDNQGNYLFAGVGAGTYPVRLVPQAGWTQTTQNPAPIGARSGQNVAGVNVGLFNNASAIAASTLSAATTQQSAGGSDDASTAPTNTHTVTVPLRDSVSGNLPGNYLEGIASLLGKFTAAFNDQGGVVFTAANGDELFALPTVLAPTEDPTVWHTEGLFVGGTGRFEGATGTFSHDVIFTDAEGDFVYEAQTVITLQRPWNDNALG